MMRSSRTLPLIAVLFFSAFTISAGPAHAQKTTIPDSLNVVNKEKAFWMSQLRLARQYGQKTLTGLQSAPTDEGAPIDESVYQAARDTYVLIRAARYGVFEAVREQHQPADPMLEITARRVNEAWNLSRTAVDAASSSISRQEYLTRSIHDLSRSMQLLDEVFVTLP